MRFVAGDLSSALKISEQYDLCHVGLLACAWTGDGKSLFGKVCEAYGEPEGGPIFIKLESGERFLSGRRQHLDHVMDGRQLYPPPAHGTD